MKDKLVTIANKYFTDNLAKEKDSHLVLSLGYLLRSESKDFPLTFK